MYLIGLALQSVHTHRLAREMILGQDHAPLAKMAKMILMLLRIGDVIHPHRRRLA